MTPTKIRVCLSCRSRPPHFRALVKCFSWPVAGHGRHRRRWSVRGEDGWERPPHAYLVADERAGRSPIVGQKAYRRTFAGFEFMCFISCVVRYGAVRTAALPVYVQRPSACTSVVRVIARLRQRPFSAIISCAAHKRHRNEVPSFPFPIMPRMPRCRFGTAMATLRCTTTPP